ncbi:MULTISPECIES: nuclear transport factor 2 family protein [unclassified Cupriavidus]|uniref:nuclear transport factor 2 family protein n=1 Tax=unclassified Cupriavidus TaxID=2640874 RepID=UPI001C004885|nr:MULTISPECIES: nuclear transport factor 2 family protein [unclassified Cupriavidus]MCA3184332.1 nuclear transport factor 2 family protein [Cupriavidus sp.]MCA3189074.1 nuclear transport factor 2 family protein [Cupriavidus sp.]MCA3198793.1 nuclear transport factor 2 family protein [Cupriavidus sp.]MCA3201539.1 nuclear transport factor 2 family protein [Cupriavidus sp.]MCA3207184.1 nuclear transport factor 2 family protein [Cupriavidus sp.]
MNHLPDMPHQHTLTPHRLAELLTWYEGLSPASLAHLDQYYAPQARFCDPFNDVRGIASIRAIFDHMFESIETPRFAIQASAISGSEAFVAWRLTGKVRRHPFDVAGCSQLSFDGDGLVASHLDFWDAATLWRQLPWIRFPAKWLSKRFSAPMR